MVPIWKLKPGDLFKLEGCEIILEFVKLDGIYAQCLTRTADMTLIGLCNVYLIQGA